MDVVARSYTCEIIARSTDDRDRLVLTVCGIGWPLSRAIAGAAATSSSGHRTKSSKSTFNVNVNAPSTMHRPATAWQSRGKGTVVQPAAFDPS